MLYKCQAPIYKLYVTRKNTSGGDNNAIVGQSQQNGNMQAFLAFQGTFNVGLWFQDLGATSHLSNAPSI